MEYISFCLTCTESGIEEVREADVDISAIAAVNEDNEKGNPFLFPLFFNNNFGVWVQIELYCEQKK